MTPPAEGASTGSRRGWSRRQQVNVVVWALAAAAAIGGALAGCHPTGTPVVDPVFAAVIAGLLTLAMSRARRIPTIVVAAGALAFARGWVFLPAGLAVAVALVTTFARRRHQCLGALVGALAAQAVLRWPAVGFHGSTALAAAGVLAVAFLSAYRQLGRRARRRSRWAVAGLAVAAVVLTVPAVLGALAARSAASAAIAEARSSLHAVGSAPTAEAESQLRAATADLHSAHGQAGSWYTAGARLVPVVAQNRQALAVATGAAERLTSAAATEVTTVDLHNLGYHDGRVDLGRLAAFRTPVATLATQSTDAQAALRSIRSPWLVPPIGDRLRSLSGELDKATGSIHLANDAVADLPGILGGNGVRHYLVILETPAEQRGLDGLLGDYAELTVDNGHIALTDAASFSKVNEALPPGGAKLTGLADYLARYGKFNPGENFEDVTYAPDLPTVGKVIQQMYSQAGGDHLDGVLALDTSGIAALLKLTGPITVPGTTTTLTADTAAD
ncbi:MAG TPA: DUF4012 domain-containing protein, partial [Acidimicrobiales bacterium]|nr:DUF4012 domain-containing protein [Acidimicrobiales bacterium]